MMGKKRKEVKKKNEGLRIMIRGRRGRGGRRRRRRKRRKRKRWWWKKVKVEWKIILKIREEIRGENKETENIMKDEESLRNRFRRLE